MSDQLALYYFPTCPYCQKVLKALEDLHMNVALRDIRQNDTFLKELINGGGKKQVPCLRIEKENKSPQWLYESQEIIDYLKSISM